MFEGSICQFDIVAKGPSLFKQKIEVAFGMWKISSEVTNLFNRLLRDLPKGQK